MSTSIAAAMCCGCTAGIGALLYRRQQQQQGSRYEALSSADLVEDDDDTDHDDSEFEEVETSAPQPDLLNFSIADSDGRSDGYSTPTGSRAQLSATSASWVEEMNAELAEFDALTGLRATPAADADGGPAWETRMEAELQAAIASPADGSLGPR